MSSEVTKLTKTSLNKNENLFNAEVISFPKDNKVEENIPMPEVEANPDINQNNDTNNDISEDIAEGISFESAAYIENNSTIDTNVTNENVGEEYIQGLGAVDVFWKNNRNDLKLKIGAGITYLVGVNNVSSSLMYYPKLEISYLKLGNEVSPYFIADGGVHQNTYKIHKST